MLYAHPSAPRPLPWLQLKRSDADVIDASAVLYSDGCYGRDGAKGLSGGMWYEDPLSLTVWRPELMECFDSCQFQVSAGDSGPPPGRYNENPCPCGCARE